MTHQLAEQHHSHVYDTLNAYLREIGMDQVWAGELVSSSGSGGGYWQLALIVAAIGFLGIFARWRKARISTAFSPESLREREENPNRYRDVADRAIVELLEVSRSLNAQVDTKIRMLNRLVKDAENNCVKLEKLLEQAQAYENRPLRTSTVTPEINPKVKEPATPTEPAFLSELHERIYLLKQQGKSMAEIAKATDLSTTEVNFIFKTF